MIPVQNVYYMLSYAFQVLNEQGYKNIATEQFNNTGELMAAILEKGIAIQIKRGLGKEYIPQSLKIRLPQMHHRFLGNWTMKKTLCCL